MLPTAAVRSKLEGKRHEQKRAVRAKRGFWTWGVAQEGCPIERGELRRSVTFIEFFELIKFIKY